MPCEQGLAGVERCSVLVPLPSLPGMLVVGLEFSLLVMPAVRVRGEVVGYKVRMCVPRRSLLPPPLTVIQTLINSFTSRLNEDGASTGALACGSSCGVSADHHQQFRT
jgi:hypothetical protein